MEVYTQTQETQWKHMQKNPPTEYGKITEEQMKEAAKKLKNRKTLNQYKIANELIKMEDRPLYLFNFVSHNGKLQEEWRNSIAIPILKKEDQTDPKSY